MIWAMTPSRSGLLPINGLQLYYEVHGDLGAPAQVPLLLIPGAFLSTESMAQWVDAFGVLEPMITSFLDEVPPASPRLW